MIRSNGSNASKLESNGKKGSCHAGSIANIFLEAERPLGVVLRQSQIGQKETDTVKL